MAASVDMHDPAPKALGGRDPRKNQYEKNKCHKKLRKLVGEALTDFNMIEDGDKVMVCLSGGKDSYTLLDLMLSFAKHAPVKFEVVAVNLDQKQPGFPEHVLPAYLDEMGVAYDVLEQDDVADLREVMLAINNPTFLDLFEAAVDKFDKERLSHRFPHQPSLVFTAVQLSQKGL